MTYLDPTYRDISDAMREQDEDRFVFMASRQPLPLHPQVADEGPVPEDAVPVEVYRRDRGSRIGQFAASEDSLEELRVLFQEPRRVGMGCREEQPGVVGQLMVLMPVSELGDMLGEAGVDQDEAWRESLPEPPDLDLDSDLAGPGELGGGPEGMPGGGDPGGLPDGTGPGDGLSGDDELADEAGRMKFGALHLGNVVRFDADRVHRGDFVQEAVDMFEKALHGDLPPLSDRLVEELAAAPLDD